MRRGLIGLLVAAALALGGAGSSEGAHCSGRAIDTVPPPVWDLDCDSVRDEIDNCPPRFENDFAMRNPDQVNTDENLDAGTSEGLPVPAGDVRGDRCDPDDDADDVLDARSGTTPADNCRTVRNPSQADDDDDGIGNACVRDWDEDGRVDPRDNCAPRFVGDDVMHNPDQADNDADGFGDVCDADDDDDYFNDGSDNCQFVWNQDQVDRDGDGLGAECDPNDTPPATQPPPSGSQQPDVTAPTLGLAVPRKLRLRELGRAIAVEVRCSEQCAIEATLIVKRKRVAAGTAALGGRGTTFVFMRKLRRLAPAVATLRLTAIDAAGNRRTAQRRVALRR
jgi:thrombospondin type 3 repeat protein